MQLADVFKKGRAYTVANASDASRNTSRNASRNNSVPLPALPGAGNQTPAREQGQMFTALVDWVERGAAPESITLVSRDKLVSYPICVYPQEAIWDGKGSRKQATSYTCR